MRISLPMIRLASLKLLIQFVLVTLLATPTAHADEIGDGYTVYPGRILEIKNGKILFDSLCLGATTWIEWTSDLHIHIDGTCRTATRDFPIGGDGCEAFEFGSDIELGYWGAYIDGSVEYTLSSAQIIYKDGVLSLLGSPSGDGSVIDYDLSFDEVTIERAESKVCPAAKEYEELFIVEPTDVEPTDEETLIHLFVEAFAYWLQQKFLIE